MTDKQINLAIGAITHAELVMDFSDVVLDALNSVIAFLATMDEQTERKKGKWIDYSSEGFVECPFCHSATNCDDNKDELHYCFSCGADMRGEQDDYR